MSVCFETSQNVIQSTFLADFSFDFAEGSFLLLNRQKHWRLVWLSQTLLYSKAYISQQVITLSDFYSTCGNKYHAIKTSSV